MSVPFSGKMRASILATMEQNQYDVFIIGGGITGAGIALDAATRGLKVALVEMQDFAGGTSSRSTKLVHGGLRYLKQFEINVVSEVGKERAIVYQNGPHVTIPQWMLLPIHKGGTFGKTTTSIGLRLYDFLARVKKEERRRMLNPAETLQKEPLLKSEGLRGSGYYVEYRTDDARLTIEVIKAAVEAGAHIVNYTKTEAFQYDTHNKVNGMIIKDTFTNKTYQVKAKRIVNAAGPWVDHVRSMDFSKNNKQLRLTKGIHIVLDQSVFPLKQSVYFDAPDNRMVFAIPRDGKTYVGTTDTFYDQEIQHPQVTVQDRNYLIHAIHYMFPKLTLTEEDVESSWAGVRPLIYEEGKDPSEISRKDEIWESDSGLITIAGGKLTGYRKMAENVVDLIMKQLTATSGIRFQPCQTKYHPISGGHLDHLADFIERKTKEATHNKMTEAEARILIQKYGSNVDTLFDYAEKANSPLPPFIYAQLMYCIEQEMVVKPVDFFIRRTGSLYFNIAWVHQWKKQVVAEMKEIMGWSSEEADSMKKELEDELHHAVTPQVKC
ncbi:glycerol-3-phosphate dehydrogenase/oxidase [Bacillus sp. FJAT-49736]|uniref:glycerol-3-phosphate dehydrogenase/oxidase n=1 Tax=Bacillus sp. FJAT-49736 TaxID=2833582 RepID=UPI001BC9C332|nr:glycerol-3-phosphate dehydrogenase/oxidase [Bacillus sp. FJAT-49736]MBS4174225.1 glycerol-3-phosphate dehydrogenase/oxidase [Bacillus sp. FJAT-49736]